VTSRLPEAVTGQFQDIRQSQIPVDARAVLEIDLDALRANWAKLNATVGPNVECAGVVKAEAYGLGLEEIATALTHEGCETFFAATLHEARKVRRVQPGARIYVLDGLLPEAAAHYAGFDLRPVLSSMLEVDEWSAFCRDEGRRRPAAVQVDTGMNRLGIPIDELPAIGGSQAAFADFEVSLVMSHLACADTPANPMNARQKQAFDEARKRLPDAPASLANSGGTFLGPDFHYDLVRPGISLYGGRAFEGGPNPVQPVVRLNARILQVRDVAAGQSIGYGAAYTLTKPSRIATIACGYADGFLRALSGDDVRPGPLGHISGLPVQVVGRVSMDLLTLDVTNIPPDLAVRGAWVEIMGDQVTLDDLTDQAGTIGYELLTRLGSRVHRIYIEDGKPH
jgi:alanine racemase